MSELLAKEAFKRRIGKIVSIKNDKELDSLKSRLKEKGTEYTIVVPLFEVLLEYDPLENFYFEKSSDENNNQRFDFSVQGRYENNLLVEAKALNVQIHKNEEDQLQNYIKTNSKYPWGILTNGIEWKFFIEKAYVELIANNGMELTKQKEPVFLLMDWSIEDEYFIEFMEAFAKDKIDDTWEKLARYALRIMEGGRGKLPCVFDGKKEIDAFIKEKIDEKLKFEAGEYFKFLNDKIEVGQNVTCENGFMKAVFYIDDLGRLVFSHGEVKDSKQFGELCKFERWFDWVNNNVAFTGVREFRLALDKENDKKHTRKVIERYPFDPDPDNL